MWFRDQGDKAWGVQPQRLSNRSLIRKLQASQSIASTPLILASSSTAKAAALNVAKVVPLVLCTYRRARYTGAE